jgi:CBS domain-containing protein
LNEATLTTGRYGQIIGAALIVFGLVSLLMSSAGSFSGLWTIIVGVFLFDAARGIMRDINDFENMSVAEAMQIPVAVLPTDTVQKIVDHVLPAHRRIALPVTVEKKLHGVLVLEDIRSLPPENWRKTTAGDVMRPVATDHFVDSRMLLSEAKTLLRDNGIGALAVVNGNGDVVGYLQRGRLRKRT